VGRQELGNRGCFGLGKIFWLCPKGVGDNLWVSSYDPPTVPAFRSGKEVHVYALVAEWDKTNLFAQRAPRDSKSRAKFEGQGLCEVFGREAHSGMQVNDGMYTHAVARPTLGIPTR
jgi:hypothetical protein